MQIQRINSNYISFGGFQSHMDKVKLSLNADDKKETKIKSQSAKIKPYLDDAIAKREPFSFEKVQDETGIPISTIFFRIKYNNTLNTLRERNKQQMRGEYTQEEISNQCDSIEAEIQKAIDSKKHITIEQIAKAVHLSTLSVSLRLHRNDDLMDLYNQANHVPSALERWYSQFD